MVQYGHTSISYIENILRIIGFVKTTGQSVLKVIEKLKKPPTKIEETSTGFRYYSPDVRNPINVEAPVHNIIQNNYVISNVYEAIAAPLEKEKDIRAVVLKPKRKRQLPVKVSRKQLAAIKEFKNRSMPKPKSDVENTTTEYLHPKRGAFDADGKQWSFHRGKEIVPANIKDEAFLERYRRAQVRLHHTDVLKVRLKQHQKVRNGKIITTYDIIEVIDYTPGEREERLLKG